MIRTVDTDVVVLAVMVSQTSLPADGELWIAFRAGKHFRYIAAHEIATSLGPDKSKALPMFHALTGCDTVSAFARHGKKTAWATWDLLPQLTQALISLSSAPTHIPAYVMCTIERFVILMYEKSSQDVNVDIARQRLFAKKPSVQAIPPTRAALEQHIKRATYQGGHVWGQTLLSEPELPSPSDWGWIRTEKGHFVPHWTSLPEASKTCYELISCKCKKGCKKRCKCKKASLKCTALCLCEGQCELHH